MKPLIVLFTLLLVGSSLIPLSEVATDPARAESLPSWTKTFHLHEGTVYQAIQYDWMNSSAPVAGIPNYNDYDGDTFPGITIRKNVPPQRWHHWILYPSVNSDVVLLNEISAHVWAKSRDNESSSQITAIFFDIVSGQFSSPDSGTEIGRVTIGMTGPVYSEFQLYTLTIAIAPYTLLSGHFLVLTLQRGDSLNDGLIVHFDKTDYDSTVVIQTSTFISMDQAWTEDQFGNARSLFSDQESPRVLGNVSDPFGAVDIIEAQASVLYAGNGTVRMSATPMNLLGADPATSPRWKLFELSLPALPADTYIVNVTARDSQGAPSWLNVSLTVVAADHFGVWAPPFVQAGRVFNMTIAALDASNDVIDNWVGNVALSAFMEDMVTPTGYTLSNSSIFISPGDAGQVNLTDQNYTHAEETIYIRASAGPHTGWSSAVVVTAGPVVNISIDPADPDPIASGTSLAFTAVGRDAHDNINTTWTSNWSMDPSTGTLVPNGHSAQFTAGTVGLVNITCRNDPTGASATAPVNVSVGALVRLEITSPAGPLTISESLSVSMTAVGYDAGDNAVDLAGLTVWTTNTSGLVVGSGGSAIYTAGYIPESGAVSVRAGALTASIVVNVVNHPYGPWMSDIPIQIRNEDSESWNVSLSGYWHDVNGTGTLEWWVEDVLTSLFFVSKDPAANSVMQFHTQPDQFGEDVFNVWVRDTSGFRTFKAVTVRILPVNDKPSFVNTPPAELYVCFDTPYTFDYSYYVYDVDNQKDELTLTASLSEYIFFDRLIGTFIFPTRDGESPYMEFVTITLHDLSDTAELKIVVRVTSDHPPDLAQDLPDIELDEGVVNYMAFDLDDYFFDFEGSYLVYTSGFQHLVVDIDPITHVVNMSAPEEWSGLTHGTFTATDPEGALKVDTVNVTIRAVNDAPVVVNPGTLHVKYNTTYILYMSQYVSDPDNSLDTLTFSFNDTRVGHNTTYTGAHILELYFLQTPTGVGEFTGPYMANVRMTVSDLEPLSATCDLRIMVSDNSPPEIIAVNPDQLYYSFSEDTYLNDTIRLYDIFSDSDDSVLTFIVSAQGNIYAQVYSTGVVNLNTTKVNWSGSEELSIKAVDSHGGWASVKAYVTVTPVNDAPVIKPIANIVNKGGPRSSHVLVSMYFYDSDDSFSNLTITGTPNENVVVVGEYMYLTLPNGVDSITVTLVANDGETNSNAITFKFSVTKTMAERIGYPYSFPMVLVLAGVAGYFIAMRLPRPHALENLFLIHNDGRLVAHVTKQENTNLDKDVVSAMFTAVQEFVRDSFQQGEVGLKKLEIGDKNVVIEKGAFAYLALIYSGWPPKETFENLAMLLRDVEERFKGKLEKWNGTGKAVKGVDKMLQEFMSDEYKPGVWHEEEELAEKEWVEILDKEA